MNRLKTFITILILLFHYVFSDAQFISFPEQDCVNAIPICSTITVQPNIYSGAGNVEGEINNLISCLGSGEQNGVWYRFTAATSGVLNFTIIPNIISNDYDWAVYNLTHANCADIFSDTTLYISCSFSPIPGHTGANGNNAPQNEAPIHVLAGESYVILITRYSTSSQSGFTLDLTASTAQIQCTLNNEVNNIENTIDIFPNPSEGKFVISLEKKYTEVVINMYDSKGNLIEQKQIFDINNILFDCPYAQGIYYIQLMFDGKLVAKKIVIN